MRNAKHSIIGATSIRIAPLIAAAIAGFVATPNSLGQFCSQTKWLTASDAAASDEFGLALDIAGDYLIIGAFQDSNSGGSEAGSAYVFKRDGTDWVQQAWLTASDASADQNFGAALAMSGSTAIIASHHAAYIFVRSGTVWTQQAILAPGAVYHGFGNSVALFDDTAVIGVPDNNSPGQVLVFQRSGTVWTQQPTLTASDPSNGDVFGRSVAIDQNTIVVGAEQANVPGQPDAGAAYVFVRNGSTWTQQAKLIASDPVTNDDFGIGVDISDDTALVGARSKNSDTGAAYVFIRTDTTWSQQANLLASDAEPNSWFGMEVALSGDSALIGAPLDDHAQGDDAGSAYLFTRSGTVWTQQNWFKASDGSADNLFFARHRPVRPDRRDRRAA